MIKAGFIDYYLNEWHANNYPLWLREQAESRGLDLDLGYAWAETENEVSTDQWCKKYQMKRMASPEALVECCDVVIVLSPDHPEHHERLSKTALESGKRVYIDKTFSPDLDSGIRLFEKADQSGTLLFSSSALRFSEELKDFREKRAKCPAFCSTTGPGVYSNYSIHQFEMLDCILGEGAKRVKATQSGSGLTIWIEYPDRLGTMLQTPTGVFSADIAWEKESIHIAECTRSFDNLIASMLDFFEKGIVPVKRDETLEAIALREAGALALQSPDIRIPVRRER